MQGINPNTPGRNEWREIASRLEAHRNRIWVGAGEFGTLTSASRSAAAAFGTFTVATATTGGGRESVAIPAWWLKGNVLATAYWTGNTAETKVVELGLSYSAYAEGEQGNADVDLAVTTAGPAAQWEIMLTSFTPFPIASPDVALGVYLQRLGAGGTDAYTGTVHFLGLLLTFQPEARR